MKRIMIILLAALTGLPLTAGPVSPGRALEIGRSILEGPATRGTASQVSILWDGETADGPKVLSPAFYVVGREEGGFVIISANDCATPILALSETNRFRAEGMPDNIRWWMEHMKAYVRAQNVQSGEIRKQWAGLAETRSGIITGTVTNKVEHLTPEWHQGGFFNNRPVYNKFCPMMNANTYTYSGCVPTALAEVLTVLSGIYPNDMPSHGTGTVGGYTPDSGCVVPASYQLSTTYDWAGIRTLVNEYTIYQAANAGNNALLDNLGHLIADCGAIVQAQYSSQGTGAYVDGNLVRRMAEHMYMSKEAYAPDYSDYTAATWLRLLKENVAERPIVYSGVTAQGSGHAFVFDGIGKFQGTDVFHVNFGWAGENNGWYFFNDLTTDLGDFAYQGVTAVLDFVPDVRQQTSQRTHIKYVPFTNPQSGITCEGITALGPVVPGQSLYVRVGGIKNVGNVSFGGKLDFYHEDKDGNRMTPSLLSLDTSSRPIDPGHLSFIESTSIRIYRAAFGDRIVGYFRSGQQAEVPIEAEGDGSIHADLPLVPAAFIDTKASYAVGDRFPLRIKNYDKLYAGTRWTITAPDGTVSTLPQSVQAFVFTQAGRYRIKAAVAPSEGAAVTEQVVAYVTVL